ncbi:hypothetical protein [Pseudactinotalea terrae]|uniref:hypothetical protein n=1 Tax=Pseudactinotalea terrae TaxID=1743262 RepID=UPI0012E2A7E2|nr:hypothetical protein [Pseudactinotalea terrae]
MYDHGEDRVEATGNWLTADEEQLVSNFRADLQLGGAIEPYVGSLNGQRVVLLDFISQETLEEAAEDLESPHYREDDDYIEASYTLVLMTTGQAVRHGLLDRGAPEPASG